MKIILGILFLILVNQSTLHAAGNQWIEGFAKWQADRIERIAVDQALDDVAHNVYIKRYFTNTSDSILFYDTISAQRLIPLLQTNIEHDLENYEVIVPCIKSKLHDDKSDLTDMVDDLKKLLSFDDKETFTVESFIEKHCKTIAAKKNNKVNLIQLTEGLMVDLERAKAFAKAFTRNVDIEGSTFKYEQFAKKLLKLLKDIEGSLPDGSSKVSYVQRVNHMLVIFDFILTSAETLGDFKGVSIASFNRVKSISLFLAELADAKNADNGADVVVAVLKQYVNEQDTYNKKRENTSYWGFMQKTNFTVSPPKKDSYFTTCIGKWFAPCRNTLFLSSYYGLSMVEVVDVNSPTGDKKVTGRAYGPVGVEFKLTNYRGSPVTLGYAPIDIGNYVTAELKGEDYDAQTEDILSPSVYLAWSMASKPLSIMVGYQRDIILENGIKDDSAFVSVSFDLPIATIW